MTEFEKRVEAGALEILNARLRKKGLAEFTLEEVQALSVVWPAVVADARAILAVTEPKHADAMGKNVDSFIKPATDHWSEGYNAAVLTIAAALREAGKE